MAHSAKYSSRSTKQSSPPAPRHPSSPPKPSLSLKLLAYTISLSPLLFDHSATELLYPLFSSAPTHAFRTSVLPFFSTLAAIFFAQKAFIKTRSSWRTCWFLMGVYKILNEGLIRWYGVKLLGLGLERGVLAGRFLLEAIPILSLVNWMWDQFDCKERAKFLPNWWIPLSWAVSSLFKHFNLYPAFTSTIPTCYILQIHGLFLVFIALFATHLSLHKIPRSHHRPQPTSRTLLSRIVLFSLALALAHSVASSSSHCPTSPRTLPSPTSTSRIIASEKSLTGTIVVGEQEISGPNGAEGYRFRYLRADHSLLGGLWTGVSENELKRMRSEVTEEEVVKRAESIYSTFILQELIRLVKTPEDLPHQEVEQGLVIGLGAGLIARALVQHQVNLSICEIDPVVYEFARDYFAVPAENVEVVLEDAKSWLARKDGQDKLFDYIVHDVFTGGQVPSSLFTQEFWSMTRERLHHSAVLAINFAGSLSSPSSKLVLTTLVDSFPHCRAFEDNPSSTSNSSIGDETILKNLVIFCSPSWFNPIRFRDPIPSDFLPYPSPQIRRKVFQDFRSQEIPLDRFKLVKEDEEGGDSEFARKHRQEWILTERNAKKLDEFQLEGTKQHWEAMEKVLPRETWATW